MSTLTIHLDNLPQNRVNAIKRRAREMGVTPASYVSQLIDHDLKNGQTPPPPAVSKSFDEIAAPFRKAFDGVSDDELDRLVDAARTRHYQRIKRKR